MKCNDYLQKKALKGQRKHARQLRRLLKKHPLKHLDTTLHQYDSSRLTYLYLGIQFSSLVSGNSLLEKLSYLTVDDLNMYYNYLHSVVKYKCVNVDPLDETNYIT